MYNEIDEVAQAAVISWMFPTRGMQQRISREAVLTDGGELFSAWDFSVPPPLLLPGLPRRKSSKSILCFTTALRSFNYRRNVFSQEKYRLVDWA